MNGRILRALLVLLFVAGDAGAALATRDAGDGRDQSYLSPTWGYMVRWYGDEWEITAETSEEGYDSLWLADAAGTIVGFEGIPGYGGDASLCLDDLVASVEAIEGVADIAAVRDEAFALEAHRDPRWSWILLLARMPGEAGMVDHAIFLDCRMLAPGEAVLARLLAGPAATFLDGWGRYDILHVTLPRAAWELDADYGYLTIGDLDGNWPRFYDQDCGAFPFRGEVHFDPAGAERLMVSVVDGRPGVFAPLSAGWERVLRLENVGTTPLTFDPGALALADARDDGMAFLAPVATVWEDTGEQGERMLAPGAWASLIVTLPAAMTPPLPGDDPLRADLLVYQSGELRDGETVLHRFGVAGGCGGGSRPRLRLSR